MSIPLAKIPPHNAEAEQAVLGAMLANQRNIPAVISKLNSGDFYKEPHAVIFASIEDLFKKSIGVDMLTVTDSLTRAGKIEVCGGPAYIVSLTDVFVTSSNLSRYCHIVKDTSKARKLIAAASEAAESCYDGEVASGVASILSGALVDLSREEVSNSATVKEILKDKIAEIDGKYKGTIKRTGLETGFSGVDKLTGGLQKSDLILIAGRPSMGKTTFAMNIASNIAREGQKVMVFSLEMAKDKLVEKQLSSISSVNLKAIQQGDILNDQTWPMLIRGCGIVENMDMVIDDSAALDIAQIQARAKLEAMKGGLDVIFVDYLQLAKARAYRNDREREVSEISAGLKALAKELRIPVVALSQLSRKCEGRTDKRPLMSDLRDSGSLEQDADVIAFVYRDEVYNDSEDNPARGKAEILIRKNRCGETGSVGLYFDGSKCLFGNLVAE